MEIVTIAIAIINSDSYRQSYTPGTVTSFAS